MCIRDRYGIEIPTVSDWETLRDAILKDGIYNQNLQAVPPTGSISYINHSTSSIHPIASKIEIRKEGKIGRVYYPAAYMTNDNLGYYKDCLLYTSSIQMYEQRRKDLGKAAVSTVLALARTLGCRIEDLLEP